MIHTCKQRARTPIYNQRHNSDTLSPSLLQSILPIFQRVKKLKQVYDNLFGNELAGFDQKNSSRLTPFW